MHSGEKYLYQTFIVEMVLLIVEKGIAYGFYV